MTDQASNLRRRMDIPPNKERAKTIAVISGKGGVGKSNFALNFSLELMNQNKKVILIDLDVGMGNINILLGAQPRYTVIDLFNKQLSVFDIMEKGPNQLSYIAGGSSLSEFLHLDDRKKDFFFAQYEELAKAYDYIIFDMGAGVTKESLFFILAADECMVITTGEPTSITDAYSMIKQVIHHGGAMPLHVVLNRARSKDEFSAIVRLGEVAERFLKVKVQPLGIIPEDKHVMEAVLRQVPYLLLNERAPAAKSIRKLTKNYLQGAKEYEQTFKPAFTERLKSLLRGNF